MFTSKGRIKPNNSHRIQEMVIYSQHFLLKVSKYLFWEGVWVPCSLPDRYKNESQKTLNFCGDSLRSFQKYGILSSWYINHSLHPNYKQHMPKSLVTLMHSVLNQFWVIKANWLVSNFMYSSHFKYELWYKIKLTSRFLTSHCRQYVGLAGDVL